MNKIKILEDKIRIANQKYWIENDPEISDTEYDSLIEELRQLDPENKLLDEFTSDVENSTEAKIVHSEPMLSLDKVYSIEELMKWIKKVSRGKEEVFQIQPKYDGLSGKLENGKLSSRGNGKVGLDYTNKLKIIEFDLSKEHSKNWNINESSLLGEMLISNKDWNSIYKNIKSKSGILFKNQRNAASGIIGTDDVDFYEKQKARIIFVDYDTSSTEVTMKDFEKNWNSTMNNIVNTVGYPIDGIVIKLKDKDYYKSLGNTEHHPRGAVAFKFTNKSKWSKLLDVQWTSGKDQLACIGVVEPVEISGTTIRNVKLQLTKPISSNVATYILDGSLQIGDDVLIERAGDIIPHIKESKPGTERKIIEVKNCPFCGAPLTIHDSFVECSNDHCSEKEIQCLYHAMVELGFKGIGEIYARKLYKHLNVKTVFDLLTVSKTDLMKNSEFGNKLIDIFLKEQAKAKTVTAEQFLVSFNIPNVGHNTSKLLLKNYSLDKIINGLTSAELSSIKGIGPTTIESIVNEVNKRKDELIKTSKLFEFANNKQEELTGDTTICFTGKMDHPRSEMETIAAKNGFVPVDHVDKNTKYLVCADPNSNSSKLQKARKIGCKIISEFEFYKMLS